MPAAVAAVGADASLPEIPLRNDSDLDSVGATAGDCQAKIPSPETPARHRAARGRIGEPVSASGWRGVQRPASTAVRKSSTARLKAPRSSTLIVLPHLR